MAGLTSTGLEIKTIEGISAALRTKLRALISAQLNTEPSSPLGKVIDTFSASLREVWELVYAVWLSNDPDAAKGLSLDNLAQLTGTTRKDATPSTVICTVSLDPGASFVPGDLVAAVVGIPERQFVNVEPVENTNVTLDTFPILFEAVTPGPTLAAALTITEIVTPQFGWVSVINFDDAVPGEDVETDPALRQRREEEIDRLGGSTLPAIRSDLLSIEGIEQVTVFENDTSVTNEDGLPKNSIEIVVYDGTPGGTNVDDATIAQSILRTKPAGIATYGTTTVVVQDDDDQPRSISFTRPAQTEVWLEIDVAVSPDYVPSTQDEIVKQQLADEGAALFGVGADVIRSRLLCEGFTDNVLDVTDLRIGLSAISVFPTNLAIGPRELSVWSTARITVNS